MSRTVWAYVNASKQVGDAESHQRCLRMPTPRKEHDPEDVAVECEVLE